MPKVVKNFVPEACVQQVQYSVFDTTYIKVNASGVAFMLWSHPVALYFMVDENF
jgi:hypothetical protein